MAKFYVVDGLSYAACEAAVGYFGKNGFHALGVCRALGFRDKSAKRSMTPANYRGLFERNHRIKSSKVDALELAVAPLVHYLMHRGFGVQVTATELAMARAYLVNGETYTEAERTVGLKGRKGFEAMYSVCKLCGFQGARSRGSLTGDEFKEMCRNFNIV